MWDIWTERIRVVRCREDKGVFSNGGPGGLQATRQVAGQRKSGVMKSYPKLDPRCDRSRAQRRKKDPLMVAARLKIKAASLRTSTSSKYKGQWQE